MNNNSIANDGTDVTRDKPPSPKTKTPLSLPCLWTTNLLAAFDLTPYFQLCDPLSPPAIIPETLHFILADHATPEALRWRAAYLIGEERALLSQCADPSESWLRGGITTHKELVIQIFQNNRPWHEWVAAQAEEKLTVADARDIAAVVLKYAPLPSTSLEQLRQRCKVSSWDWKAILDELRRHLPPAPPDADVAKRLRLDIQRYASESDPIAKTLLKNEICARYHLRQNDVTQLANWSDHAAITVKATRYSAAEFMQLETQGIEWLFPGILPRQGVTILAGDPGIGKTTLAYDVAVSLLLNEAFLTELPTPSTRPYKVLFVASDELPAYVQDKLTTRGAYASVQWDELIVAQGQFVRIAPLGWMDDEVEVFNAYGVHWKIMVLVIPEGNPDYD